MAIFNDPFILIGLWVVLAFVLAAVPSRDNHWRRAYILMAVGFPLLGWITWVHGPIYGVIGLFIGCSICAGRCISFGFGSSQSLRGTNMSQVMIIGGMLLSAALPFVVMAWLMRVGQSGLALTIGSLIGAILVILIFASGRPIGIEPVFAMSLAMLLFLPALMGATAGAFLGWLLRKQDDKRV